MLTSHSNPDGDALGSGLATYHFLKQMGHDVKFLVPNPYPDFLNWMPGQEDIIIYEKDREIADKLFGNAELLFSLDYNAPSRLGIAEDAFKNAKGIKIMIDHHISPEIEAYDHICSTVDTSSTSELVFDFIEAIDSNLLNIPIAECLYTGIMTDTGSFSYACNSEKTFLTASILVKTGMDCVRINRMVYNTYSEGRLRLLGYALSEKLKVFPELSTAYISLSRDELNRFNYQVGDTEGLVNYALSIKGIKLAALFTERKDKIRISFRSVGGFSVNDLARKYFEGGGHKNAAGGDSYLPMDKTLEKFEKLIITFKNDLKYK
ncbi:MAG: bifunctional oligoribonuclease/PAP phosphatase NrnA [Bacteroidales bacterium]